MMKIGLKEINELNGVWGSFIANNRGEVLFSAAPPDLNEPVQENISRHLLELIRFSGDQLNELFETIIHYSRKKLFVVDLESVILVVVCTPSVDLSLLRMTVNVVRAGWDDDPKVQTLLKKNYVERI